MTKSWLFLALPLMIPLFLIFRLLRRRTGGGSGPGGPPFSDVREPRRPKPSPPAAAEALPVP